jgi:hypothetical protein
MNRGGHGAKGLSTQGLAYSEYHRMLKFFS